MLYDSELDGKIVVAAVVVGRPSPIVPPDPLGKVSDS